MANTPRKYHSKGTRTFHGHADGTIYECRFVQRAATTGNLIACATANRPIGVSPANFVAGDDADYDKQGISAVETDGSAAVGDTVKAATDGSGKAIKDISPGGTPSVFSYGVLLTLDATSNIGDVEAFG